MRITLLLIGMLAAYGGLAQDSARVSVRANIQESRIQLRWAVSTPMAWKQCNQYGVTVERYTVTRNGVMLDKPERVLLTPTPLKPHPLNDWEQLATQNNYAAVIAQALYGETFQLSGDDATGVSKFIALAQELEQRFMVSLYAADLCYPAAVLAGWGLDDATVEAGCQYLYRVVPAVPAEVMTITLGGAYIGLEDRKPLPQPQELTAVFGDKSALLTWNYGLLKNFYNAYFIEKSTDGTQYHRLTDIPVTNMNAPDGKPAERMYYMDTLSANGVKTYYRVIGVNAFSEEGPASEPVSGVGASRLAYVPHIQKTMPNATGAVDITWEFDPRGNELIKGFELQYAPQAAGPFVPVVKNIAPQSRSVTYDDLMPSNYFVIAAIPQQGNPVASFPVLVQPADSIPPAVPAGLQGMIDSLGVVSLTWQPNTEKDLLGYRIFRGQTETEELIPLNDVAIRDARFADTVVVKSLNSRVYYAVAALDKRYNQSPLSPVVIVQKPEVVPPSPPLITAYESTHEGVVLTWVTGGEETIRTVQLYRGSKGDKNPALLVTLPDSVTTYTDASALSGQLYSYTIQAVTGSGLASASSPAVTVRPATEAAKAGEVRVFTGKYNRRSKHIDLAWEHDARGVKQIELYKAEAGQPMTLWKVIKGFNTTLEDEAVKPDVRYEYMLRTVLDTGRYGGMARVVIGH